MPPAGAGLAAAKLRLLARMRGKTTDAGAGATSAITPRPSGAVLPLSFAQERLWFLQQWEPASSVYNVARAWRLKGALDVALLGRCVQLIIQRHEVLRTVFANGGDGPVQQILPATAPVLQIFDLRHVAGHLRDREIGLRVAAEAGHCFTLAAEPLLRLALLQLDRQDHVFVFVAHQAVCDGRSLDLFYRELEALYANRGARRSRVPRRVAGAVWRLRALAAPGFRPCGFGVLTGVLEKTIGRRLAGSRSAGGQAEAGCGELSRRAAENYCRQSAHRGAQASERAAHRLRCSSL